jgi:hypothetical protein
VDEDVARDLDSPVALAMIGLISEALALFDRMTLFPLADEGVGGTLDWESSNA